MSDKENLKSSFSPEIEKVTLTSDEKVSEETTKEQSATKENQREQSVVKEGQKESQKAVETEQTAATTQTGSTLQAVATTHGRDRSDNALQDAEQQDKSKKEILKKFKNEIDSTSDVEKIRDSQAPQNQESLNSLFDDSIPENEFLIKYFFGISPNELHDADSARKAIYTLVVGLIPQEWRHIYRNSCKRLW